MGDEFKFAAGGSWDMNWGDNDPSGQDLALSGTGDWFGSNIVVNGTLDGDYVFRFNDRTAAYSLDGEQADVILDVPDDFYYDMGLEEVVTPMRLRGMGAILARIKRQVREERPTS